jgi:hypothetical protein
MIYPTTLEQKLVEVGYDEMTVTEKNQLISILANKAGKMYYDITVDDILAHNRELKIELLSEECELTIIEGFVSSNGHTYRTNGNDRENMIGKAVQLILDTTVTNVQWKTEDVGYIDHPRADWLEKVFLEAISFKENTLYRYNTLKGKVIAATTNAEVLAITWDQLI